MANWFSQLVGLPDIDFGLLREGQTLGGARFDKEEVLTDSDRKLQTLLSIGPMMYVRTTAVHRPLKHKGRYMSIAERRS